MKEESGSRAGAPPPPLPAGAGSFSSVYPPPLPETNRPASSNTLHLRRTAVIDRQGFGRALEAMHLLIPADWRDHGEVVWNSSNSCQAEVRQFQWRADAPDGNAGIEFLPGQAWEQATSMGYTGRGESGCRQGNLQSIRLYIEQLARQRRPGAVVTNYEDFTHELADASAQLRASIPQVPGMDQRVWLEAGQVSLSYDEGGRRMREVIFSAGMFMTFSGEYGISMAMGVVPAPLTVAFRAPEEQFDQRLVEVIAQSFQVGEEWNRRIMELDARIAGVTMDEMRKRHQIDMDTINYIGGLSRSSYETRVASNERTGHAFNQTIRGVQTWRDPSAGGEGFELPMGYANAWRLDDDSFILTDNADFHPYSALGLRGRKLERAR